MPPVLYVQGANDIVHPKVDLERFVASYRKRGGEVDLALYEGEGGGFIRDPASKAAPLAMQRIVDFVHAASGLSGKAEIDACKGRLGGSLRGKRGLISGALCGREKLRRARLHPPYSLISASTRRPFSERRLVRAANLEVACSGLFQ
jgi:hypothetical protein